jgi:hypothetical protein
MKAILLTGALLASCGLAIGKLPPPDDAAKAKAAETTAKAAWQAKVDGYKLCQSQDKVAARYAKSGAKAAAAKNVKTVAAAPAASAASASQPGASGTPVAYKPPPPCQDPGPFAYNPPEQKPLETSGAHSPSGTAATPPSVKPHAAEMAPAKK